MSAERVVYSIQRTYTLTEKSKPEGKIVTCNQRIDIPTIEPLPSVKPVSYDGKPLTVVPCIELSGEFLSEFNLTFETNEGVTVLPIKIASGQDDPLENPYKHFRYVLVLPRGATGVKSCKLIHKATRKEVQHNLTFGIMPPPYNYDNALFGYLINNTIKNANSISNLLLRIQNAKIKKKSRRIVDLPKGEVEQTMQISSGESIFYAKFNYPSTSGTTIHNPKIKLGSDYGNLTYNLSLSKTKNIVLIDLLAGMITVYDGVNYETIQQFMIDYRANSFMKIIFSGFDDIVSPTLPVIVKGYVLDA